VHAAQLPQPARAERGEPEAHDAVIRRVDVAGNETGLGRAIDEPDRAVMTEQERFRDVPDRRTRRFPMAADDEQELVLRGRDTHVRGLLLAPPEEVAEPGAELEKGAVVVLGKLGGHTYIS